MRDAERVQHVGRLGHMAAGMVQDQPTARFQAFDPSGIGLSRVIGMVPRVCINEIRAAFPVSVFVVEIPLRGVFKLRGGFGISVPMTLASFGFLRNYACSLPHRTPLHRPKSIGQKEDAGLFDKLGAHLGLVTLFLHATVGLTIVKHMLHKADALFHIGRRNASSNLDCYLESRFLGLAPDGLWSSLTASLSAISAPALRYHCLTANLPASPRLGHRSLQRKQQGKENARRACKPDSVQGPDLRRSLWMTIPLPHPLPGRSSCQPGPLG